MGLHVDTLDSTSSAGRLLVTTMVRSSLEIGTLLRLVQATATVVWWWGSTGWEPMGCVFTPEWIRELIVDDDSANTVANRQNEGSKCGRESRDGEAVEQPLMRYSIICLFTVDESRNATISTLTQVRTSGQSAWIFLQWWWGEDFVEEKESVFSWFQNRAHEGEAPRWKIRAESKSSLNHLHQESLKDGDPLVQGVWDTIKTWGRILFRVSNCE